MKLETSRGWIDAADLAVETETSVTPAGPLTTTRYLYAGEVVKIDQHLRVAEVLLADGINQL